MGSSPPYVTDALAPSTGALLKLQPHGATPPVDAYVGNNDRLSIKVWNAVANVTVSVTMRLLLPDGSIALNQWQITPSTDRSANTLIQSLTEGFMLSLTVTGAVLGSGNRTYVSIKLLYGAGLSTPNTQVLVQGYLSVERFLSWPPGTLENGTDGAGAIVSVTGTLPGVGVEITEVVPAGVIWELKTFTFQLTTGAAVANRIPHLIVDDGVNVLLASPATTPLTASSLGRYVTGDDALSTAAIDGTQWMQSVAGLRLMPGYRVRTVTNGLQAADQYGAPQYLVTEWLFT